MTASTRRGTRLLKSSISSSDVCLAVFCCAKRAAAGTCCTVCADGVGAGASFVDQFAGEERFECRGERGHDRCWSARADRRPGRAAPVLLATASRSQPVTGTVTPGSEGARS